MDVNTFAALHIIRCWLHSIHNAITHTPAHAHLPHLRPAGALDQLHRVRPRDDERWSRRHEVRRVQRRAVLRVIDELRAVRFGSGARSYRTNGL